MTDYTYEIAWWPATDALKKDVNAYKPAADIVAKHTHLPIFAGLSVEKGDFFLLVTWENAAAHSAFLAHPDAAALAKDHPELFPPEGAAGVLGVCHAHLNADPLSVLSAPVVENAFLTPKENESFDELTKTLVGVEAKRAEGGGGKYGSGTIVGTIEERPDQLVVLVGWNSVEAHTAYIAPDGPAADFVPKLREKIKGVEVHHVTYTRLA
ncbi:unnamed protein product [Peniophora sp. CBMAI 1063]|nr:unnamed protein product [Peniophora sp. CBMAI 1063]